MELVRTKLGNGLPVIAQPMEVRSASIVVTVRAGTRYETPETNGLSHFQEHMFFRGGIRYPNEETVTRAVDAVGGWQNAFTWYDWVRYELKIPASEIGLGFDLLSDMLINGQFHTEDIEQERGPVLQEINQALDDADDLVYQAVRHVRTDRSSAMHMGVLGPSENIRRFIRDDFVQFQENFYTADRTLVSVVGGVNPAEVQDLASRYFDALPTTSTRNVPEGSFVPRADGVRITAIPADRKQVQIGLVVPAPIAQSAEEPAAMLLSRVLGGGMSSRLFLRVRSELGLAYGVGSLLENSTDDGMLYCYAGVEPERAAEAVGVIIETCASMAADPPADGYADARRGVRGERDLLTEDSLRVARKLTELSLREGTEVSLDSWVRQCDAVVSEDVDRLASSMFENGSFRLGLSGPVDDAMLQEITGQVPEFSGAETEIVEPAT